jgi:hypothetical protein
MSGFDFLPDAPAELALPNAGLSYPTIQWSSEEGAWLATVEKLRSFGLTLDWPARHVSFGRGKARTQEECFVDQAPQVAILAIRTLWFDRQSGQRVDGYAPGHYSKQQLLSLVRGSSNWQPVQLTTKSVAAGEFSKDLTRLRRLLSTAQRQAGKALPPALFWWTLPLGNVKTVQGIEIQAPGIELPGPGQDLAEWLQARYIGPELAAVVTDLAGEAVEWAAVGEAAPPAPAANGHNGNGKAAFGEVGSGYFWQLAKLLKLDSFAATAEIAQEAERTGNWRQAVEWLHVQQADVEVAGF